jgi:hypothetical protein
MKLRGAAKRLKTKKLLISLVCVVLIGLAAVIFTSLNGPSVGTVNNQVLPASDSQPPPTHQVDVKGKTITFSYPSNFLAKGTETPSGNEIETFAYVKQPSPFWFLNITVSNLTSGNLSDDGSYNMRALDTARYKKSQEIINGATATTFFDSSNGYAKTAFMAHSGKDISISLQSNDTPSADKLDQIFDGVLKSLRWLN